MQAYDYFKLSVQKLEKLYSSEEAHEILYWVFEDVLLIRKAHLQLFHKEIGFAEEMKLEQIMERLLNHEPLQYVLGYAHFRKLTLKVSPAVLIPRPETEELVEWILQLVKEKFTSDTSLSILDIGTGSGCIAISLEKEIQQAQISALDISPEALSVAAENAKSNQADIQFHVGSILEAQEKQWAIDQQFDILVSNPPYIKEEEKAAMQANVTEHEPHLALFVANESPLIFYQNILEVFLASEKTKYAFFEISEFQEIALTSLCKENRISFEFRKDLQGKTRMLLIAK